MLPGHVDTHVHTRSEPAEGITAATRAAAAGGATTVVDMPYDDPEPVTTAEAFRAKAAAVEREAVVDVALYATIAPRDGLAEIDGLVDAGRGRVQGLDLRHAPRALPAHPGRRAVPRDAGDRPARRR